MTNESNQPALIAYTVRQNGAVPATIAVMSGQLHIGLDDDRLETLARARSVAKLSRADLAVCLASGKSGATTVAATYVTSARAHVHAPHLLLTDEEVAGAASGR